MIEFDPAKDARNREKHGVSLAMVADFDLARTLSAPAQTVGGESRQSLICEVDGAIYTAIVTPRGKKLRVISVRMASRKEREAYVTSLRHS